MASDSILLVADHGDCRFKIEEDETAGFYVFRFEGDSNRSTHDYLQDSLAAAKEFALEEWGVPQAAWHSPREEAE